MAHPLQGICPFGLLAAHSNCCSSGKREAQMKTKTQICCFFFYINFSFYFLPLCQSILRILPPLELELEPESVSVSEQEPKPEPKSKPNPVTGRTRSSFAKVYAKLMQISLSSSLLPPPSPISMGCLAIIISTSLRCVLSHFYSYLHLYCGIYLGIKCISTNVCVSRSIPVKEKFTQNNNKK